MATELSPDQKGFASLTLGQVIAETRTNFPDPRFQPQIFAETAQYHLYGINPAPYPFYVTADGIGTKPELAERLAELNRAINSGRANYEHFQSLAQDTFAMVESDQARFGYFTLGIANVIDMNQASAETIPYLARGAKIACDQGKFALLNGEIAELSHRVGGYGDTHLNWNAFGVSLINPDKLLLGQDLAPGQFLVAFREKSIRSNGLTAVRHILESSFLDQNQSRSRNEYLAREVALALGDKLPPFKLITRPVTSLVKTIEAQVSKTLGVDIFGNLPIPWHEMFPELIKELLRPSTLFSPLMYDAQGGVDGPQRINMVAAAHISGGGVPEKVKRMIEAKGLGAYIDTVFPDPRAITEVMEIDQRLANKYSRPRLIDDQDASTTWNRGIGFIIVVKTAEDAGNLVHLASELGYESAIAGQVLDTPQIEWRGHIWKY